MEKNNKYIKPAQFAESEIIKAIVSNKWACGHKLPPERELAELLGITRPTLREVLQRLSRDGWIEIKHGKPTTVNNYKEDGGLGILKTLANHNELYSKDLIKDWLEFRIIIMPSLALKAIMANSKLVIEKLNQAPNVDSISEDFASFDWELQLLLIKLSKNSIAQMLFNDLTTIYNKEGSIYFNDKYIKNKTVIYYNNLKKAIEKNTDYKEIVKQSMQESYHIWIRVKSTTSGQAYEV